MGNVTTLKTLDSSIISLIILIFIFFSSYSRTDRLFRAHKLFTSLVLVNILMIIVDYLSWAFNGYSGSVYLILNTGFNLLLYVLGPVAPMLWILYVNYQILKDERSLNKLKPVLLTLFAVNAAVCTASVFTGWYFSVDAQNIYHRGPFFLIYVLFNYALMASSFFFVLRHRRVIEKKYFLSLLLFFIPPTIGVLIQIHVYGVSYNWVGMALSVLIIYFNIQNRGLNTDYLTGAYNNRQLDAYTKSRIKGGGEESSFSAIMFDLDNLKEINDTLGHDTGDEALKDTVSIVRHSIRENDFVARVGGDEFVVVLDIRDDAELERTKARIEENIEAFNTQGGRPYDISISCGSGVYDIKSGTTLQDFFRQLDALMYKEKYEKKSRQES